MVAKSRFVCGPPRLNLPTGESGDTLPIYIPGQHILGDIDFTDPTDTEIYTESNDSANNIKLIQGNNGTNVTSKVDEVEKKPEIKPGTIGTSKVDEVEKKPEIKPTTKFQVPNKKMAIMITPPPDIAGYKIVNKDGTEINQDNTWHILHGNGNLFGF